MIITILFSEKFVAAHIATLFLVEAAILAIPIKAFLSFFNAIGLRIISVKSMLPTAFASLIFYPVLSRYAGANGAGIATLLTCMVWLSIYLFYYINLMKEKLNK